MLAILLIIAGICLWLGGYLIGRSFSEIKWEKKEVLWENKLKVKKKEMELREELWKKKWKTKWKEEMDKDD